MTPQRAGAAVVGLGTPLAPEERARAEVYALLATLWTRAPDAGLLAALGGASRLDEDGPSGWPAAFNRLVDASSVMDAGSAEQEYTDLFIGVGKSEIELRAAFWLSGELRDRHLAELRAELKRLGLGRRAEASMTEDQLGPLLETMRLLIAGNAGIPPAGATVQQAFFERWLAPWVEQCCVAVGETAIANYYRRVAECTRIFVAIERDSFAID